jgi:transcriptional regulator with XRE-family HTH domain
MQKLINQLLKKFTMEELRKAGGYGTKQSIYNLAQGVTNLPINKQKLMSQALGVPLDKFKKAYLSDIKAMY